MGDTHPRRTQARSPYPRGLVQPGQGLSCGELATRWGQKIGNGIPPPVLGGDTCLSPIKAKTPRKIPYGLLGGGLSSRWVGVWGDGLLPREAGLGNREVLHITGVILR